MAKDISLRTGGYPGHWVGRFIWDHNTNSTPYHYHLMLRKSFELDRPSQQALLHVAAADKYMLWVNGCYVGRGPCRSMGPERMYYDTHDITAWLRDGKNAIAVHAYFYGCSNHFSSNQRTGLFAQAELTGSDGAVKVFGSDDSWRVCPVAGYERDAERMGGTSGIVNEILDGRKETVGWQGTDFDDTSWETALPITYYEVSPQPPWSYLEPRVTPLLRESDAYPVRLVETGEAKPLEHYGYRTKINYRVAIPELLAEERHTPPKHTRTEDAESLINHAGRMPVYGTGNLAPYLVFDFGRPIFGHVHLEFEAPAGTVVDITYDLQLTDGRVVTTSTGLSRGDRYIARAGKQTWQLYDVRCLRYLQVVVRPPSGTAEPAVLTMVKMVASEYPAERLGSFSCSDDILSKVWKMGVDTAYLHIQDSLVFDPVRELMTYSILGESENIFKALYVSYGDLAVTELMFAMTANNQLRDGLLNISNGGASAVGIVMPEGVPSVSYAVPSTSTYPAHYTIYGSAVWNRYCHFGDKGFLRRQYPALLRLLDWYERHTDTDGLLFNLPYNQFMDWPLHERYRNGKNNYYAGANFAFNVLLCKFYDAMASIASALDNADDHVRFTGAAERLRLTLRRCHWNAERGLYVELYDGAQSRIVTELSNGLALRHGIATDEQRPRIIAALLNPPADMVRASPLYYPWVLEGLIAGGAVEPALDNISSRYRSMVQFSDFPTLHEKWLEHDTVSCSCDSSIHGGGCGVVWIITKCLLGVQPLEPGFAKCRIAPQPGRLTQAEGVFPSVRGNIAVSWRRDGKAMTLEASIPDGIETEIVLPCGNPLKARIMHNGRTVKSADAIRLERGAGVRVQGGKHTVVQEFE